MRRVPPERNEAAKSLVHGGDGGLQSWQPSHVDEKRCCCLQADPVEGLRIVEGENASVGILVVAFQQGIQGHDGGVHVA